MNWVVVAYREGFGGAENFWFPRADGFILALLDDYDMTVIEVDGVSNHGTVYVMVLLVIVVVGWEPGIEERVVGLGGRVRHEVYVQFFGV